MHSFLQPFEEEEGEYLGDLAEEAEGGVGRVREDLGRVGHGVLDGWREEEGRRKGGGGDAIT